MAAAFQEFHVGKHNAEMLARTPEKTEKGGPLLMPFVVICMPVSLEIALCLMLGLEQMAKGVRGRRASRDMAYRMCWVG